MPEPVFNDIALSLSGGGARAIGFHLGTLDYLHHVNLLNQVRILSTVSGGSLIGTCYVLAQAEHIDFADLFYDLFEFLPQAKMTAGLLEIMSRPDPPVASGRRGLTTALAEMYQESFFSRYFENPVFGAIRLGLDQPFGHLEDISFNATEMKTGIAFRFQKSANRCKVGNGSIWLESCDADEMRIADIVTASSCVPGAFEPMRLPSDFHWPESFTQGQQVGQRFGPVKLSSNHDQPAVESLALMDGGVYDNQGLTTVLLAVARRGSADASQLDAAENENNDPQSWGRWSRELFSRRLVPDLFIISDTPLRRDTFYPKPSQRPTAGLGSWLRQRKLGDLDLFVLTGACLMLMAAAYSLFHLAVEPGPLVERLIRAIPAVVAGLVSGVLLVARWVLARTAHRAQGKIPGLTIPLKLCLRNLDLGGVWDMVRVRISSLLALATEVFGHRIRQLEYSLAFSQEHLAANLLPHEIWTLAGWGDGSGPDDEWAPLAGSPEPSLIVQAIAQIAARVPGKASFDTVTAKRISSECTVTLTPQQVQDILHREDGSVRTELDVLTACGQAALCYNLLKHLDARRKIAGHTAEAVFAIDALIRQAQADWLGLQERPFRMVDERLKAGRSAKRQAQIQRILERANEL